MPRRCGISSSLGISIFYQPSLRRSSSRVPCWVNSSARKHLPWCDTGYNTCLSGVSCASPSSPFTGLEVLGAGEREALALVEELHADLVLIDEDKGRQIARSRGLQVTGTLGVLDIAAERRFIDLPTALTQLQATDFYVTQGLIDALLAQDAARKRTQFPDQP